MPKTISSEVEINNANLRKKLPKKYPEDLKSFLVAQSHAIDKSIYIESEKAKRNLRLNLNGQETQEYFIVWINKHASAFRDAWEVSVCKDCSKLLTCHDCLKEECEKLDKK
jgi:hypothetical protein